MSVAVGLALVAFAGVGLATNVPASHGQTALEQSGGDSPGPGDNPEDDGGTKGGDDSGTKGGDDSGNKGGDDSGNKGENDSGNKGEFASGGGNRSSSPAAAKQSGTGARGGSLPFTGYLAIPVLLIGIAMLGTGFVLRRRAF